MDDSTASTSPVASFFEEPRTRIFTTLAGIRLGIERVFNPLVAIGGAYGAWGDSFDNQSLPSLVEQRLGGELPDNEKLNLGELGFTSRHHVSNLTPEQNRQLEIEVGARFLQEAAGACGWEPGEVEGVLLGVSAPLGDDYTEAIAAAAGIPEHAIKVSVHKACDSSVGGLHLALNPALPENNHLPVNLAERLFGRKILVGGIEGLSRFVERSHDSNALQLFGNGAGVIGVIPGRTMKFLTGKSHNVFDLDGVLQVHMQYPHSPLQTGDNDLVEVSQVSGDHFRIAGLMHEPEDGTNIKMAGPMGMVKLFVRTGVQVVQDVYRAYQDRLVELGESGKSIAAAVVHHANYKINKLKEKNLQKEGINLPMPWLLSEFGNVSAASNMIAFLRQLPALKPGDHVMLDGFGAGTYYDTLVVELQS